jgi:hypothetical protein
MCGYNGSVVASSCQHPLCDLIGGPCSLASGRSRGCTAAITSKTVAPEVFEEVRALLAVIEVHDERARAAAVRLAEIIRREAREDRNLITHARTDEPELAPALASLCLRRHDGAADR